jgi:hypothetical protein
MRIDPNGLHHSARTVSDAGAFFERAAHAARPSASSIGRVGAAITAVRLGARLLPAGRRLFNRYPVAATLIIAGSIAALYWGRSMRSSSRS